MDEIAKILRKNRPNITDSSVVTYVSLIKNLLKKMNEGDIKILNEKPDKVIEFIKQNSKSSQTAKTLLSAIVIYTNNDKYREIMVHYIDQVNDKYKQKRTDQKRLDSGLTSEKINDIYELMKNKVKHNPTHENWINYIILCLYSGKFIPVRRSLDYIAMKIRNFDRKKDNFFEKNYFYFNQFKTAKNVSDENKKIINPSELLKILNKWKKLNIDNDFLIFQKNAKPFTSSSLNKKLQSIFGENTGIDLLRSIYLTKNYGDIADKIQEINDATKAMGTSTNSALQYYIKKDIE
jgi:hypothetical protein